MNQDPDRVQERLVQLFQRAEQHEGTLMTVRKRGASWYVDICDKGRPRVQRVIKGARTKTDALRVEAKLRTEIFEKRYGLVEKPEYRFDKFVDDSFLPFKKLKKSYTSIESVCRGLKSYFGKYLISEIDTELIEKYRQVRVEQKTRLGRLRSPLRVNKEIQVLSSIFTLALEKQLIRSRPRTPMFRVSSQRIRYLSSDEEIRLLAALNDCEWLKRLVVMALHTGMRRGEICSLQWSDIHLDRRLIHLRNTKNGKDRIVPMNATVLRLFENQNQVSSYVFPSPRTGQPVVETKTAFSKALKAAQIADLRFHDLRHSAATRMGQAGVDPFTLASIFGWSDIRMAMRYTHALEESKRRAVEALERA